MPEMKNRWPGVAPRTSGSDFDSSSSAKVIQLRPGNKTNPPRPFDQLTANLVLAQFRAGTLPEAVMVAMMASAGLRP